MSWNQSGGQLIPPTCCKDGIRTCVMCTLFETSLPVESEVGGLLEQGANPALKNSSGKTAKEALELGVRWLSAAGFGIHLSMLTS